MHIEVDSHTHTVASGHAYSTLAENISEAAANNLKLLAVTDHGPAMPGAPHFWYFMNMKVIPRVMNGVGILRGVEANIKNVQGELDISDEIYNQMDIVIGSLHDPIIAPTDKTDHTEAVINAMASGKIDVFGHGGNPIFPIDAEEVAKAAAHYRVLIEINNSSFITSRVGSKDNCRALAEAVGRQNGYLTFGTDAHIACNVGQFDACRSFINEIGFPEEFILSSNGVRFLDFLARKEHRNLVELKQFCLGS